MVQRTTNPELADSASAGRWTPEGEGESRVYTMEDFRIRWLAYAQCWRGSHRGETLITASDLRAVMSYCEALGHHNAPN